MYDLRHTLATLSLLDGWDLKVVSAMLGHSTITLTANTYSHLPPAMVEGVAESMQKRFGAKTLAIG